MTRTRRFQRALSLVCTLCLLFSLFAGGVSALASDEDEQTAAEEIAAAPEPAPASGESAAPDPEGPADAPSAETTQDGEAGAPAGAPEEGAPGDDGEPEPPEPAPDGEAAPGDGAPEDDGEPEPPEPAPDGETAPGDGEEPEPSDADARTRGARDAATSTDLRDFLVSVVIDAPLDENGHYIVNPNSTYEMTLKFRENESLQFADEETLVYRFPDGLSVGDFGPVTFSLKVEDHDGVAMISGNTYEVVNGRLLVRFNQDDPNFARLKASANANFEITLASSFDENAGEITFAPGIVKEFVYDNSADLTINKSVVYDKDTDTASYVLQICSAGQNENVVIEDRLTGTALTFNRDVTIESSLHGPLSVTPDYTSVDNGFRVSIPQLANGETLTLRYTAAVDNDKITGTGTVEETNNTAHVTSDQVPEGKEANADFHGDVTFHQVNKSRVGEPTLLDDGTYEATWLVRVNMDHKLTVGGHEIRDWVGTASQPFMQFGGEGLSVQVTFEDGTTEMRTIPWSELTTSSNDKGIIGWSYTPPESDGKAAYQIVCKTVIDPSGALGNLNVTNYALFNGRETSASQTVQVVTDDGLTIRKEAVGTTDTESEWKLTVTVPGSGLPDLRVVDTFPRMTYAVGVRYYDGYLDGSLDVVSGLLPGESWNLYVGSDGHSYTLTFYQDAGQTTGGVLPTADGQPRQIVIRFKTTVNQDWLTLAAEDGYQDYHLYAHFNHADARSLDYRTPDAEAYVVPIRPDFVKSLVGRDEVEIDGVTYPVFRYTLGMYGPLEDGVTVHDAFDTTYLRYYEGETIQIFGGFSLSPTDSNGTISVTGTEDGMDILVSRFPKTSTGAFYPYYSIEYSLIVKDTEALLALNEAAALSQTGVDLENTAVWSGMESAQVVNYAYFPYVDKEQTQGPSSENGYIAEFKVVINKYAEDLDPTSDELAVRDILSDNLRFLPDSLTISPASDSIEVQYDAEENTLTFLHVPDETTYEITYQTRVLGQGSVTYSNTIQFGKYEKTIQESTTVESSGGGSASNPSITLVKRDAASLSTTLAGAMFQLFYLQENDPVPVTDRNGRPVFFTTGSDGTVLIAGNQQDLGWALWAGRTYCLVEIAAPTGYELDPEPTFFVLSETPANQTEYTITGDQLSILNTVRKISIPVTKQWIGPAAGPVTVVLTADGEVVRTAELSEANQWQAAFEDLPKYDSTDGHEIVYDVQEDPVPGYEPERSGTVETGFTFTNTITGRISIPVTKQWIGPAAGPVTVVLTADGEVVRTAELNEANQWQTTFEDLDQYSSGTEIVYRLEELDVPGYSSEIVPQEDGGYTIVNTNIETISIPVTKRWIGPGADAITMALTADGVVVRTAELSEANRWRTTFEDLPKYDSTDGHKIVYDVREDLMPEYALERDGTVETGFTFTNTNITTRQVTVEKRWKGAPLSGVTVRLYADYKEIDRVTLRAENAWKHTFEELPQYDPEDGHRILYTISEDTVKGYTVSITGDMEDGFIITNTKTPTGDTPKTGDNTPLRLYFLTMVISGTGLLGMGCAGLIARKRKRKKAGTDRT